MTQRIQIIPLAFDQQSILFYGRRVGYCGDKPGMTVKWLTDAQSKHGPQCGLTDEEKDECRQYVIDQLGSILIAGKIVGSLENEELIDSGDTSSG